MAHESIYEEMSYPDRFYGASEKNAFELLRLSPEETIALADMLRMQVNGDIVSYVINRNINFTNQCVGTCQFCAFRQDDGYILSTEEILQKVGEAVSLNATEICLQGGLLDGKDIDYYCDLLEQIKSYAPSIHLHAFSPMEIWHMAHNSDLSVEAIIRELKRCGLDSMPGTAAEVLVDRVRKIICPDKLSTEQWIDVIRTAHRLGVPTTATMMYGHVETAEERVQHMLTIRSIQKETGGFTEFVPLPFLAQNTLLGASSFNRTELDDILVHAIARIILHGQIDNIQMSWVKLGVDSVRKMLNCGVNDLGGTLMEENISRAAGATTGEYLSPEQFDQLIRSASRTPIKRTTLYELYG